jgi:hypothetical protein
MSNRPVSGRISPARTGLFSLTLLPCGIKKGLLKLQLQKPGTTNFREEAFLERIRSKIWVQPLFVQIAFQNHSGIWPGWFCFYIPAWRAIFY